MELIYRGIKYVADDPKLPARISEADKNKVNPRQSNQIKINANFPLFGYLKQLFFQSDSKTIFDPITFWYIHKRKYLESCWPLDEREKFERCWELTLEVKSPSLLQKTEAQNKFALRKFRGNQIPAPDSPKPTNYQKSGQASPGCGADRPIKLKYRGVTYYR